MAITYEQLFDILRREKSRDELQQLDPGFYPDCKRFLEEKQHAMTQATSKGLDSLAAQRAQIEHTNVKKILRELYDRRERKIMTMGLHKTRTQAAIVDTEALLPQERGLYDSLIETLMLKRAELLAFSPPADPIPATPAPVPREKPAPIETEEGDTASQPPEQDVVEVRFLATVPKFVGKNMEVFGPFQEGQTSNLPKQIADILLRKGRAELLS